MEDVVANKIKDINSSMEESRDVEQYVSFLIGSETYGVSVLLVQEIIGMTEITHVPKTLEFVKGVINLRGTVVPVLDMRSKFKMETLEYGSSTIIIIVEVNNRLIGMIVDSVSDVLSIPVKSIQDTPHFSTQIETDYILGIGQSNDDLVIILNVDKIIATDDFNTSDQHDT